MTRSRMSSKRTRADLLICCSFWFLCFSHLSWDKRETEVRLVPHQDSVSFSIDLLEKAKVAVTPGSAFGPSGAHHVRMAYCVSEETINLAFDRLERAFGR